MLVNVVDVLDGNTLVVSPPWCVGGITGHLVHIRGMDAPDLRTPQGQMARCEVCLLLIGSPVTVTHAYEPKGAVLPCDIEFGGLPLWMHFPEFAECALHDSDYASELDERQLPEIVITVDP